MLHHGESKIPWLCSKWNISKKQWGTAKKKKKIKQSINPSETQIIHLPLSLKYRTSTKFSRLELLKKTLSLHKHRNIILKLHDPNQRKMGSHVLSDHGIPWVHFYFYFCLRPTVRKYTWMRLTSVTVMVIFSKLSFWKLLDHSYVQSCFSNQHVTKPTANKPSYFQNNNILEIALSNFHSLTVTEFIMEFQKLKAQVIMYRIYKRFDKDKFQEEIKTAIW